MIEFFEHRLSERLHAHPLPDELAGLTCAACDWVNRMRVGGSVLLSPS